MNISSSLFFDVKNEVFGERWSKKSKPSPKLSNSDTFTTSISRAFVIKSQYLNAPPPVI
jgi:hypothetical protein